jgi:hypothetical protein
MHLTLREVDRFVKKLEPVNALIEKLCERLLPHEVAYANHCAAYTCMHDWGCGVKTGTAYAYYCIQYESGQYVYLHCGC